MKRFTCALLFLSFVYPSIARAQTQTPVADCACESQVLPETLAVVNGVKITRTDLAKSTGESVSELQQQVIDARKRELDLIINSKLLTLEAKKLALSPEKLLEQEIVAKVKRPTQTEAQVFYDQNKARIQGEFKDIADDIVEYLFAQRQREEAKKFADNLRSVAEVKVHVTDVTNVKPPATAEESARVVATMKGESITAGDVENALRPLITNVQQQVYKLRKDELELSINDALLVQEAEKRKVTVEALLAAEVKPKTVTEEQTKTFYEQNKERVSGDFAQTKDAIKQYLEQVELRQAERTFVEKLRAAATIQVFLTAPVALP